MKIVAPRSEWLAENRLQSKKAGGPVPGHARTAEEWDPDTYPAYIAAKENYEELHQALVDATRGSQVRSILDLGVGTGETCRRVLVAHPDASVVGVDANQRMLDAASASLPEGRSTMVCGRMEGDLPGGPFDLVVSVLAVHHLDGAGKRALFGKIATALAPGGLFVLGDLVKEPSVVRRIRRSVRDYGLLATAGSVIRGRSGGRVGYAEPDQPDLLDDQLRWMAESGLRGRVVWDEDLVVVIRAEKVESP